MIAVLINVASGVRQRNNCARVPSVRADEAPPSITIIASIVYRPNSGWQKLIRFEIGRSARRNKKRRKTHARARSLNERNARRREMNDNVISANAREDRARNARSAECASCFAKIGNSGGTTTAASRLSILYGTSGTKCAAGISSVRF